MPRKPFKGGIQVVIGYLLSPLSWWDDLFINVPLAVAFGWVVSLFYRPAFSASVIIGYWLTNIVGLVLMHKGARNLVTGETHVSVRRQWLMDLLVSLLYTGVIVLLIRWNILTARPWESGP